MQHGPAEVERRRSTDGPLAGHFGIFSSWRPATDGRQARGTIPGSPPKLTNASERLDRTFSINPYLPWPCKPEARTMATENGWPWISGAESGTDVGHWSSSMRSEMATSPWTLNDDRPANETARRPVRGLRAGCRRDSGGRARHFAADLRDERGRSRQLRDAMSACHHNDWKRGNEWRWLKPGAYLRDLNHDISILLGL